MEIVKNKVFYIAIAIAIVLGICIGWSLRSPESNQIEAGHSHETAQEIWTCSMHPQIRQTSPGQCPLCGMDLIPAASAEAKGTNPAVMEMTPEAVAMARIQTSKVSGGEGEGMRNFSGKIQYDERRMASIVAEFPGRIEGLYVNYTGQQVRSGQRLATIYSPELVSAQQELLEAASAKAKWPSLYAAAREKLKLWKLTEAQIDAIEARGEAQTRFDVLASRGGVVTNRLVAVGDYVSTGSTLFEVIDLSLVWVLIDAYESDLPFVKVGSKVTFEAEGVPGKQFSAKISYVDPLVNPETRTITLRAEAQNANGELKPGMFINARVAVSGAMMGKEMLQIPRSAVLWTGKRSVVYVAVPGADRPEFEMRVVTLGAMVGEYYQILSGLEAGEEVVTNGAFTIDASAQLAGKNSLMNRPDNKKIEVSAVFKDQFNTLLQAYFVIKNALIEDDTQTVQEKVSDLENAYNAVDMKLLEEEAHNKWMEGLQKMKKASATLVVEKDISGKREGFMHFSNALIELIEVFGADEQVIYKDYCPMAFGDKGAYWLSAEKEIKNPYFGASMLTCGEVKAQF